MYVCRILAQIVFAYIRHQQVQTSRVAFNSPSTSSKLASEGSSYMESTESIHTAHPARISDHPAIPNEDENQPDAAVMDDGHTSGSRKPFLQVSTK